MSLATAGYRCSYISLFKNNRRVIHFIRSFADVHPSQHLSAQIQRVAPSGGRFQLESACSSDSLPGGEEIHHRCHHIQEELLTYHR